MLKSPVSICYCGDMKCIQVKNGLWQFSTYKNDKLLCICVCGVCMYVCTRVCIHLFIKKKSSTSDNMTWCLYHYVVLNNGPAFNPWKQWGYNTCTLRRKKSIGLKFSKSWTGSHVTYSCHHNSSRFTCPIFVHSWHFSVFHSLQSITPRIY